MKKIVLGILLFSVVAYAANIFHQPVVIKNTLSVSGNSDHGNLRLSGNTLSATNSNGMIFLSPNGSGLVRTDNLSFDGNTIASQDTNGNIELEPNGTGLLRSTKKTAFTSAMAIGQNSAANASALLEMVSTSLGFLPPRMTEAQRDLISGPATGLVVYNTTTNALNFYDSSSWVPVGSGSGGGAGGIPYRLYCPDSLCASKEVLSNGLEVWNFTNTDDLIVYLKFVVPESYTTTSQIFLKSGKAFSSVNTGNFLFSATSYIFKGNIDATSVPTGHASTNTQQAIDATANEIVSIDDIDLTDVDGEINSVAVAPGDTILIKLIRSASTETSGVAGIVRLIDESFEIDVTE